MLNTKIVTKVANIITHNIVIIKSLGVEPDYSMFIYPEQVRLLLANWAQCQPFEHGCRL